MRGLLSKIGTIIAIVTLSIAFALTLSGWQNKNQLNSYQYLNEQSVLAVNWLQQSGEYIALAHQAFNSGKIAFKQALNKGIDNPAVIVDIDETLLNNSAYQARLIDSDKSFYSNSWNEWVKAAKATSVPGAINFVDYIQANGGKVFFISNREFSSTKEQDNNDLELATIKNLKAVGFNGVDESSVLLKGEFTKFINGQEKKSKEFRRQAVINGQVDGNKYNVVVLVGDNLNDFFSLSKGSNQLRRQQVEAKQKQYGIFDAIKDNNVIEPALIILPNPMYGYWESGLYQPEKFGKKRWYQLSPQERNQQRKEALIRWHD